MIKVNSTERLIARAREIHGDKYNLSLIEYRGNKTKVPIVCPEHGIFYMNPNNFLNGQGCPICGKLKQIAAQTFDRDVFIANATSVHGDRYDYSMVEYKTARIKVKIICREHGVFLQTPDHHVSRGHGCPHCGNIEISRRKSVTQQEFIDRAIETHGVKYDYSLVEYRRMIIPVSIICHKHGVFKQVPIYHINGGGCPSCKKSKGEELIANVLGDTGISFIREKTFPSCAILRVMRFYFFIPDLNLIIEYHGIQHFTPIERQGGLNSLMIVKRNDEYKKAWALASGYRFKEYKWSDSWDYIARSIRGLCAYYRNN